MHELSIALSMIEQIELEVDRLGGGVVEAVYLRVGTLAGVDTEALRFAYELARAGTSLSKSRLEIETVELAVYCRQCQRTRSPAPQQIGCPHCPGAIQDVLAGKELEIKSLEIC